MALYYCPSEFKFKGFYRRGAALAHLKLWKKAIAGQSSLRSLRASLTRFRRQISKKHFASNRTMSSLSENSPPQRSSCDRFSVNQ